MIAFTSLVTASSEATEPLRMVASSALVGEEATPPPSYLEQGLWAILVIGAIIVAFMAFQLYRRWQDFQEQQELADATFEASVLAEVYGASAKTEARLAENVSEEIPLTQHVSPSLNPLSEPKVGWLQAFEGSCEFVLHQLRNAGLLERIESYIPLHGNPSGAAVLILKDKKRVLLIPYYETEIFTERELRQYDALIFVSRSGRGVFIQSIESLIADKFSS